MKAVSEAKTKSFDRLYQFLDIGGITRDLSQVNRIEDARVKFWFKREI